MPATPEHAASPARRAPFSQNDPSAANTPPQLWRASPLKREPDAQKQSCARQPGAELQVNVAAGISASPMHKKGSTLLALTTDLGATLTVQKPDVAPAQEHQPPPQAAPRVEPLRVEAKLVPERLPEDRWLTASQVDSKLWRDAAAAGWTVMVRSKQSGHYWYVSPQGVRFASRSQAQLSASASSVPLSAIPSNVISPLERSVSRDTSVTVSTSALPGLSPSPSPVPMGSGRMNIPGGFSFNREKRTHENASYFCAFPNCRRRYSNADHVRKHCRKKHGKWLKDVDAALRQQGKRDASSYCVIVPEGQQPPWSDEPAHEAYYYDDDDELADDDEFDDEPLRPPPRCAQIFGTPVPSTGIKSKARDAHEGSPEELDNDELEALVSDDRPREAAMERQPAVPSTHHHADALQALLMVAAGESAAIPHTPCASEQSPRFDSSPMELSDEPSGLPLAEVVSDADSEEGEGEYASEDEMEFERAPARGRQGIVSHERHDLQQLFRQAVRRDREARAQSKSKSRGIVKGGGRPGAADDDDLPLFVSDRNESGFKGVHRSATGKWLCQLSYNNTNYKVGVYDSRHQAARAYAVCAQMVKGFKARGGHGPVKTPTTIAASAAPADAFRALLAATAEEPPPLSRVASTAYSVASEMEEAEREPAAAAAYYPPGAHVDHDATRLVVVPTRGETRIDGKLYLQSRAPLTVTLHAPQSPAGTRVRLMLVDNNDRALMPQWRVLEPHDVQATVNADGVASFDHLRITTTPYKENVAHLRLAAVPVESADAPAAQHAVAQTEPLYLVGKLSRSLNKAAASRGDESLSYRRQTQAARAGDAEEASPTGGCDACLGKHRAHTCGRAQTPRSAPYMGFKSDAADDAAGLLLAMGQ